MAVTKKFRNEGDTECCFKIWGNTNQAPTEYRVKPGETCDVPAGYAGNFMKRRAPMMKPCDGSAAPAPKPEPKPAPKAEAKKPEPKPEPAPKAEAKKDGPFHGLGGKKKKGKK